MTYDLPRGPWPLPTRVTPEEACALLESWSPATRRLVAQLVGVHFLVEDLPPLSFAPEHAPLVRPLLLEDLVLDLGEREQHRYDADWGAVPPGLLAVGLNLRLASLVLALLADEPQDAGVLYDLTLARAPPLRIFPG